MSGRISLNDFVLTERYANTFKDGSFIIVAPEGYDIIVDDPKELTLTFTQTLGATTPLYFAKQFTFMDGGTRMSAIEVTFGGLAADRQFTGAINVQNLALSPNGGSSGGSRDLEVDIYSMADFAALNYTDISLYPLDVNESGVSTSTRLLAVMAQSEDENNAVLTVPSKTVRIGQNVELPLSLTDNPGFAGMSVKVTYPSELSRESCVLGSIAPNATIGPEIKGSEFNYFFIIWGNQSDYTGDGILASVIFSISQDAALGDYPITLTFESVVGAELPTNDKDEEVNINIVNGVLKLISFIYGDANDDGKVSTADLVRIAQFLAGYPDIAISLSPADCNGDGKVSTADLVRLAQYLAGYGVILGPASS